MTCVVVAWVERIETFSMEDGGLDQVRVETRPDERLEALRELGDEGGQLFWLHEREVIRCLGGGELQL